MEWLAVQWLLGYVSVSVLALFLLDRAHRQSMVKMEIVIGVLEGRIRFLEAAVESMRKDGSNAPVGKV